MPELLDDFAAEFAAALVTVLDPDDADRIDSAAIDRQTNLLSLPLDSAALLELMTRLEDTYRVFIPHEKAFEFETVGAIGDYISERLTAKAARG